MQIDSSMSLSLIALIVSSVSAYYFRKQAVFLRDQITVLNKQVELNNTQLISDHERSRRELAIELVLKYTIHLNKKASLARKLVENFTDAQARSLSNSEPITLDKKYLSFVNGCLTDSPHNAAADNEKELVLKENEVSEIRWLIISYLNLLEVVLIAWHNNIADRQIIEDQFGFLIVKEKGHFILEKFRTAAGTNNYPSIEYFVSEITKKRASARNGKTALPTV